MKHRIKQTTKKLTSAFLSAALLASIVALPSFASPTSEAILKGSTATGQEGASLNAQIQTVTNLLLFLIGVIAVIAIIIGGIRYTTSNGDASQTKAAKDTIMYAVIGLIVAIMAYAIVTWIVNTFV